MKQKFPKILVNFVRLSFFQKFRNMLFHSSLEISGNSNENFSSNGKRPSFLFAIRQRRIIRYYKNHFPLSLDIDECSLLTHKCHRKSRCINRPGSYLCRCKPGYFGNGFNCSSKLTTCFNVRPLVRIGRV